MQHTVLLALSSTLIKPFLRYPPKAKSCHFASKCRKRWPSFVHTTSKIYHGFFWKKYHFTKATSLLQNAWGFLQRTFDVKHDDQCHLQMYIRLSYIDFYTAHMFIGKSFLKCTKQKRDLFGTLYAAAANFMLCLLWIILRLVRTEASKIGCSF